MSLSDMQRDFRAWLTTGSEPAARRIGPSARNGLLVYQNNYRTQLVACLGETFERVKAWLGEDAFRPAAIVHIDATVPHDWTLDRYGRDFPDTLRTLYPQDPEVAELAWLDCALADAFVGPDVEPLTGEALATIDWDRAVLHLSPTLQIGEVTTNSTAIWSALSSGAMSPAVEVLSERAALLVWRKEFTSCFRTLVAEEARALADIRAGVTFGALCAMLVSAKGESEGVAQAGAFLGQWLRDGLIVSVSTEPEHVLQKFHDFTP